MTPKPRSKPFQPTEELRGYALAVSVFIHAFDQPGMAYEVLANAGIDNERALDSLGLEEYDADALRRVIRTERPYKWRRRKRTTVEELSTI